MIGSIENIVTPRNDIRVPKEFIEHGMEITSTRNNDSVGGSLGNNKNKVWKRAGRRNKIVRDECGNKTLISSTKYIIYNEY